MASAAALSDTDFILPQYRELGAAFWRGFTFEDTANQLCSNSLDPAKGRQLPLHIGDRSKRFFYVKSTLGTQCPPLLTSAPRRRRHRAVRTCDAGPLAHGAYSTLAPGFGVPCVLLYTVAPQVPSRRGRGAGTQTHGEAERGADLLRRGLCLGRRHPVGAQHRRGAQGANHLLLPQQRLRNQHAGARSSRWGGACMGGWVALYGEMGGAWVGCASCGRGV